MVGSLAGTDGMFRKDGTVGTESHFGVGEHGEIYQWVDTAYTADANYLGSGHVISIETADYGGSFGRWNTGGDNVPYWNTKQIVSIVKIIVWACKTHNIPIKQMNSVRDRGIGYHAMGVPNYGLPNSLKGTRYQWSKYPGKVCPGRKRISQVPSIIRLAQGGANTATEPAEPKKEGILGMSKYLYSPVHKAAQKLARHRWKTLAVGKNAWTILTCDGDPHMTQVQVTVEGLKPSETIQLRFVVASYKRGSKTIIDGYYPKDERPGSTGSTFITHTQIGSSSKGKNGRSNRLRVQVWTNSKTAKITTVQTKSLKG
ncbi:hypothetical protein CIK65_00890 [Brevibacterium aurantiacum]|uniref:N-acetylmuramoyl-L-alanine amidase domain-containing protein n=1 Tax=Brevibacterium aurantiacum TaxID=273384 RepID=A0A2A3YZN2_BREAU|nr:hypothetical protein CIK65_00890 [Brevibacterium aurantiacum]